jgi:hypothetical protein
VGLDCVSLLGSQLAPEDLLGVPQIIDGVTRFCPPAMIAREQPYCLFLDELNACSQDVQKAFYSLILERRVGEYVMPEGSIVIAAGNRAQDSAIVRTMSSALINRMIHVQLKVSASEWLQWAQQAQLHTLVLEYLAQRPDHLWSQPPKHEEAFSTPRSWHMLSDALQSYGDALNLQTLEALAAAASRPSMRRSSRPSTSWPTTATVWTPSSRATPTGPMRRRTEMCCISWPRPSARVCSRSCPPTSSKAAASCSKPCTAPRPCSRSWPRSAWKWRRSSPPKATARPCPPGIWWKSCATCHAWWKRAKRPEPDGQSPNARNAATQAYTQGLAMLQAHPIFSELSRSLGFVRGAQSGCPAHGWAQASLNHQRFTGQIDIHPKRMASPEEWAYCLGRATLSYALELFQRDRSHWANGARPAMWSRPASSRPSSSAVRPKAWNCPTDCPSATRPSGMSSSANKAYPPGRSR